MMYNYFEYPEANKYQEDKLHMKFEEQQQRRHLHCNSHNMFVLQDYGIGMNHNHCKL